MSPARTPSPLAFVPTTALLLLVGWGGLILLFSFTEPTLFPRWLFFFFVLVAFTGLALPGTAFLNHRFPSDPPVRVQVIVRQAIWVGVYFSTLAWLLYGRVFNISLVIILAIAFLGIELFMRIRERSEWQPREDSDDE
jgi:hypothetical protein